jgi:MFS family permease
MDRPLLSVAAILFGISIVSLGQGMLGTLVPIRLSDLGVRADLIGLVVAASALGFLAGCVFVAHVIRLVGHIRAFSAFAAASCLAGLALPWLISVTAWCGLRFAMGFCSAGLFMVAESWLNELTPRDSRGRMLTTYVVTVMLAWGVGQAALAWLPIADPMTFVIGAGAFALALMPVALTRARHPTVPHRIRLDLPMAWRNSPVGTVGCVMVGLLAATLQGVGPVWGAEKGFDTATVATLMAATQLGGLLCQWPLGWLSDRIDRRRVILAATASILAVAMILWVAGPASFVLLLLLFALWGGTAEAIYPISIAHANDHARPEEYVSLSGTLLILWATGSAVGPLIASGAMERFGPDALFGYAALLSAGFAGFVVWRMIRRGTVPAAEAEHFAGIASAASPCPAELDPRIRPEHERARERAPGDAPTSAAA